jgi:hypothetical protein
VKYTPLTDMPMIAREMQDVSPFASIFLYCFWYWTHFGFTIGAGKITTLLAVKSVDAEALRHTFDHLGRPEGTPVKAFKAFIT